MIQQNGFAESVRNSRHSGSVLKVRLSNIRSRYSSAIIAVVEGNVDIGPYEVWINRIFVNQSVEFVDAAGKYQILDLRQRLQNDRTGLSDSVYMFVDKDFDNLQNQEEGDDIFVTDGYSVENYFVSEITLKSILTDEFRCTADTDHREHLLNLFQQVLTQFNDCMTDANRRLFFASSLDLRGPGIEDRINRYVAISYDKVISKHNHSDLVNLIKLNREPTSDEIQSLDTQFSKLDPILDYRGKFLISFIKFWLMSLADESSTGNQILFPRPQSVRYNSEVTMSLRSLATRSQTPTHLEKFIRQMRSPSLT